MSVRLRSEHARGEAAARRLRRAARRFLAALGRGEAELSILLTGDAGIRRVNRAWRGVDRPTDVLSFPAAPAPAGAPATLGDVVVSLDTARRRAGPGARALGAELDRYLAHGLLHLLGFDHERPRDARAMAAQEEALLRGQGLIARAGAAAEPPEPRPRSKSRPGSRSPSRSGPGPGPKPAPGPESRPRTRIARR